MSTRSPRRNRAEWSRLVDEWRASGESAEEFASSRDFSRTTLYWWASALRKERPRQSKSAPKRTQEKSQSRFVSVVIPQPVAPSLPEGRIEIALRSGRTVRVVGVVDAAALRVVIAEAERC
jgi:hypothetical protein